MINLSACCEYGFGRPDLIIRDREKRRIIVIETKHSKSKGQMLHDCELALRQINLRQYVNQFLNGFQNIFCYGIAFCKKECLVKKVDEVVL